MELVIHFFKKRKDLIESQKFFEFFNNENFTITNLEEKVLLIKPFPDLDYDLTFEITKNNIIKKAYTLDSLYENLNMNVKFDVLLPLYIIEYIFKLIDNFTKKYHLYVYNEYFKTIYEYDYNEFAEFFAIARDTHIEEVSLKNNNLDKYKIDSEVLFNICKYQNTYEELKSYYKNTISVLPYILLTDRFDNIKLAMTFNYKEATIFPPHLDLIFITTDNDIPLLVEAKDFFKIVNKFLKVVPGFMKGTKVLKNEDVKKVKKNLKKISKSRINHQNYKRINLTECMDDL